MIKITLQRYDENPDGTILKTEVFAVGICSVPNETRLARNRYLRLEGKPKIIMVVIILQECTKVAKITWNNKE